MTGTGLRAGAPPALLLVLGVVTVQLVRTGAHVRYVKPGLAPWLVVTGAVLVVLGVAGLFAAASGTSAQRPPAPRVGWLLLVPVGLLVVVAPPALGSYGLEGRATTVREAREPLGALPPPREGAVELTLREYAQRAAFQPATLQGARLRLVGFAVPATGEEAARHGAGFYLTRIALNCCAADGTAVRVFVRTAAAPATDTWWSVEGSAPAGGGPAPGSSEDAVLEGARVEPVPQPANPYTR